jgi:hypothetical protein
VQKGDDLKGFNDGMAAMVMHGAANRYIIPPKDRLMFDR